MIGVILYTLLELTNFYLAYSCVFGMRFTKKRLPYIMVIVGACTAQVAVQYWVDDTWRDLLVLGMGLAGAIILIEGKKWKTILLYPMAFFLPSLINTIGSYGLAALLGTTQEVVLDSTIFTMLSQFTAICIFILFDIIMGKKKSSQTSLTSGQHFVLLIGAMCFCVVITFSQGLLREDTEIVTEMKDVTATAGFVIAFVFIGLSIWQQITWKKAMQYRMDNEKYEIYLEKQEEYIRMLIVEDEKRRKLRHDMNAHMLALDTMVEKEEWNGLREYLGQMKDSINETAVNKYTMISAVDAIVDEWHRKSLQLI